MARWGSSLAPGEGHDAIGSGSGSESEAPDALSGDGADEPSVLVVRAELVRGHRPVVVSEVPVYITLRDREGRLFEDKGGNANVRYQWLRGPVIRSCFYHPHKMSQIRDVARTYQCYCSKECFLRGWHNLPRQMWGTKPDEDLEEPLAEWVEVARTRQYCPSQQDIDRPLRLDIIPVLKDGRDSEKGRMSLTTGTVIPTPKEARTRRMITSSPQFNAEWLSKQFKVMNWNILADLYATESVYPYCEKWALSWTWRKHLILKEVKSMAADIITLQEVQKDAYDDWFRPQLAEAGYEGIYQAKQRDPIFHRGKYTAEGCATFYKTTRFKRIDKQVVNYDRLSTDHVKAAFNGQEQQSCDRAIQRLSKGNVALALILEDLHIRTTSSNQATGPNGGHCLCVVNTHILCDPGAADVKLCQAHFLMKALKQICSQFSNMPMLICGDFNSTQDSAVYEYLCQGCVRPDHEELRADPCGLVQKMDFRHGVHMASAYKVCNDGHEATYTNYTEDFKGTLDYIWYTPEALDVLAITQVDEESQLMQETALPSSTRPSDHVSLVATFKFHDSPMESQEVHHHGSRQGMQGMGGGMPGGGHPYHMGGGNPMGQGEGMYMPAAVYGHPHAASFL